MIPATYENSRILRREAPVPTPTLWLGWRVPTEHLPEGELLRLMPDVLEAAYYAQLQCFDRTVSRVQVVAKVGFERFS